MLSALLLALVGDWLAQAEAGRRDRILQDALSVRIDRCGPAPIPGLLTRYEHEYPGWKLLDKLWDGSRRDMLRVAARHVEDEGLAEIQALRRNPERFPVLVLEDEMGEIESVDDPDRVAVLLAGGMMDGVPACVRRRDWDRTPQGRRDLAIRFYGETDNPDLVGFILADGRWVDFSKGSDTRAQDHRNVGWLVPEDERATVKDAQSERTEVMNLWMDKTGAVRVSLSRDHAMVDLPNDVDAVKAVLRDPQVLGRFLRYCRTVDLGWRDQAWTDLTRSEAQAVLRDLREQAS